MKFILRLFNVYITSLSFILFLDTILLAQAPAILWTKTYGKGIGNCVIETNNGEYVLVADNRPWIGGYITTGSTSFYYDDNREILLIKVDADPTYTDEDINIISTDFHLNQNYPNPFNPVTIISYQLPMTNDVELSIFNVLGQRVATLVNEKQTAGKYQIEWDARDFASGVYYYRLEAGNFVQTRKMICLK